MSNVGVWKKGEKDSGAEVTKASEAEGDSLEGLDGIVTTLGKPVGQANVKCVEYVGLPVLQHSAAGIEL